MYFSLLPYYLVLDKLLLSCIKRELYRGCEDERPSRYHKHRFFDNVNNYFFLFQMHYSQLSSKQQLIIKLAIITLVIVGVAGAVLPPVYLFIINQTNPQCK